MDWWPLQVEEKLKTFHMQRNVLSIEQSCVLWGTCVIVPTKLRKIVTWTTHGQLFCGGWCTFQMDGSFQDDKNNLSSPHHKTEETAAYGLPEDIVTDNAITFISKEFQTFVTKNVIQHSTSAPRHPSTDGFAERVVCTLKEGLKKLRNSELDLEDKLSMFLLQYCIEPTCATGHLQLTSPWSDMFELEWTLSSLIA